MSDRVDRETVRCPHRDDGACMSCIRDADASGEFATDGGERQSQRTLHVPPKYNLRGNRQLWFFETGNHTVDHVGNGIISGLLFTAMIVGGVALGGGL